MWYCQSSSLCGSVQLVSGVRKCLSEIILCVDCFWYVIPGC